MEVNPVFCCPVNYTIMTTIPALPHNNLHATRNTNKVGTDLHIMWDLSFWVAHVLSELTGVPSSSIVWLVGQLNFRFLNGSPLRNLITNQCCKGNYNWHFVKRHLSCIQFLYHQHRFPVPVFDSDICTEADVFPVWFNLQFWRNAKNVISI